MIDSDKEEIVKELSKKYDMAEESMRFNDNKLKWSLVHYESMNPLVEVLMFGAAKYAPRNWMIKLDLEEIKESAMRHLMAMMDGEENDPESGLPHAGHIMCNMMFYNYHKKKEENEER